MLEDLEASKHELGVQGYGLSETTLEEVFLAVNSKGALLPSSSAEHADHTYLDMSEQASPHDSLLGHSAEGAPLPNSSSFGGDLRRPTRVLVCSLIFLTIHREQQQACSALAQPHSSQLVRLDHRCQVVDGRCCQPLCF